MNLTTTPNTASMPPVNLTQAINIISLFTNATTWPNTTSFQQITSHNATSTLASTHAPSKPLSGNCQSFEYDFHKNIPISAVCGICFLFGLMLVFVGYRAFRVSMFIVGLTLASVLTYLILERETKLGLLWTSTISAGAGLFLGLLSASVPLFGLAMAIFLQGGFCAIVILFVFNVFLSQHVFWICIGTLAGSTLLFSAILAFKMRQAAIVYITSVGAIMIMVSVDYFLDMFLVASYAYNLIYGIKGRKPCWFSWIIFAIWPFLLVLGCCVQFLKTARGYYHSPAVEKKAKESTYKTDSTGRSRRLYDNGDVIAQAWIQTTEDTLDKRRSFTPPDYENDSSDDRENTTLV